MKKLIALLESKAFNDIFSIVVFLIIPGCAGMELLSDGHKTLAYLLAFSAFWALVTRHSLDELEKSTKNNKDG